MNRREFILGSAGVMLVSPKTLWGADAPSNRLRLCVAGCWAGGRGRQPMMSAAELPGVEIACVCDVDSRARDWAANQILQKTGKAPDRAEDIRRVLERKDIDGVIIEVPDHWHAPMAWMAMEAGKHVYCEKPCTFSASEGEILVKVQKKTGKCFQMGNQRRSSIAYQRCVAEIRKGVIGEVKYARTWYRNNRKSIGKGNVSAPPSWLNWDLWQGPCPRADYFDNLVHYNWHWFYKYGTGEISNNAVHYLDVARWALGCELPTTVSAIGTSGFSPEGDWEWPDTQMITCKFPDEKLITWEGASRAPGEKPYGWYAGALVYGTKGTILFRPDDRCELYDVTGKQKLREWNGDDVLAGDPAKLWKAKLDYWHMENLVAAIRADDPSLARSPVVDGVVSSHISHLANISYRSGETIHADPKTGALIGKTGAEFWGREYEKGWEYRG